jgi:hypothetical protein
MPIIPRISTLRSARPRCLSVRASETALMAAMSFSCCDTSDSVSMMRLDVNAEVGRGLCYGNLKEFMVMANNIVLWREESGILYARQLHPDMIECCGIGVANSQHRGASPI